MYVTELRPVEHEPTPQAISRVFNNLGTAYQALNELDKAEENYDLALSQSIYGNDLPGQARVYGNIGNVLMLRKDYERAIPHYTEVLHLSRDRSTVSTAFHNRGCSYYEWAESRKATSCGVIQVHTPLSEIRFTWILAFTLLLHVKKLVPVWSHFPCHTYSHPVFEVHPIQT